MLGGREDRVGGLEVVALEAAHARLGDAATQIDILARALGNSAPARIARDVDHRCEGPVYAFGRSFGGRNSRSEEHTSELQSLMRISYAVFCLKKKKKYN